MNKFIIDLHDPHYVSTLYNVDRPEGEAPIKIGTELLTVDRLPTNAAKKRGFKGQCHIYVVPPGLRKIPRQHWTFNASGEEAGQL